MGYGAGMNSALSPVGNRHGESYMAEIRVAPQRRNRAMVWMMVVALVVVAVVAWYFLAGPGAGA